MAATPIADALQPLNVQMAAVIKNLQDMQAANQKLNQTTIQTKATTVQWTSALGRLTTGFQQSMAILTFSMNQVQDLVGRIGSQVGSMVAKYDPTSMKRFQLAADDLTATIGYSLRPLLERFTLLVRALADGFASLTGPGKTLVAGLAAAALGMSVAAGAAFALSGAISAATGGLTGILTLVGAAVGAVVGAGAGMSFTMKDMAGVQTLVATIARSLTLVMNTLGSALNKVALALEPVMDMLGEQFAKVAKVLADAISDNIGVIETLATAIGGVLSSTMEMLASNAKVIIPIIGQLWEMFAKLVDPLLSVVTVIQQFQGAVFQIVGVLVQVFITGLQPVIQTLSIALKVLVFPFTILTKVLSTLAGLINGILQPAFKALGSVMQIPLKIIEAMVQAIQGTMLKALGTLTSSLDELKTSFGEVFRLIEDVVDAIGQELMSVMSDLVVLVLKPMTTAVGELARQFRLLAWMIRETTDFIRSSLGLPNRDTFKKGAGDGAAIRNVQTTSVQAMFDQAMKDAFSVGVDPEKQTADNTNQIKIKLEDIERILTEAVKQLPDAIGTAVGNRLSDAVKAVSPASRLTNGAGMGLGADLLQKMITG